MEAYILSPFGVMEEGLLLEEMLIIKRETGTFCFNSITPPPSFKMVYLKTKPF